MPNLFLQLTIIVSIALVLLTGFGVVVHRSRRLPVQSFPQQLPKQAPQQAQAQQVIVENHNQNTLVLDEETKALLQRIADALEAHDSNTPVTVLSTLVKPEEATSSNITVTAKMLRNYLKNHTWEEATVYFGMSRMTISRKLKQKGGK